MAINSINNRISVKPANTKPNTPGLNNAATTQANAVDKTETPIATRIKTALASSPDNSARIESIKQAIADGSYKVDAERVAAKILQSEKSLP